MVFPDKRERTCERSSDLDPIQDLWDEVGRWLGVRSYLPAPVPDLTNDLVDVNEQIPAAKFGEKSSQESQGCYYFFYNI